MSNPLETSLMGVVLQNPVIAASGTFGFGHEYASLIDVSRLGGICGKGLTLHAHTGNEGLRVMETPAGLLNSIGLENPGVRHFVEAEAPFMHSLGCAVIANLSGHSEEEYLKGAELLNGAAIDILELNISCPNLARGGMAFGVLPDSAAHITKGVKAVTKHPLLVKLSPNARDIVEVALACEAAGADGLSLVNTFQGMAVDVKNRRAAFQNIYAGLSGPAIRPIALRMVHQVAGRVSLPVVGIGGIVSADDALAFLMAGATCIQVGAATFARPQAMLDIIEGLREYCEAEGLQSIGEIRGIL